MGIDIDNVMSILSDNIARSTVIVILGSTSALIYFEEISSQETPEIISSAVIVLSFVGFLAGILSIIFQVNSIR
jgi:hypothetical protein